MTAYHHFYKKLEQLSKQLFPSLSGVEAPAWDHLVSPLEIRLSRRIYEQAHAAIRSLHALTRRPEYAARLETVPLISSTHTRHESALMAYDFHTSEQGECFLVEVNTNAAGYLLAAIMEMAHDESGGLQRIEKLRATFESELRLWGKSSSQPAIAITDEDIPAQKMYPEFVMYRDLFRQSGWTSEFCEGKDFSLDKNGKLQAPCVGRPDLIYNRLTDFYLEAPQNSALRHAFSEQSACVTPNPREYWLLADKQRLVDFSSPGFLQSAGATAEEIAALEKVLIPSFEMKSFPSQDEIWSERKNLFFKPKRSHGGKSVYRGESVSRKVFERLLQEDVLIQQFRPAQKVPTDDPRSVLENWKFDLRFFVYRDEIQMVAARIYQGQVTNFASPLGGFTRVRFT